MRRLEVEVAEVALQRDHDPAGQDGFDLAEVLVVGARRVGDADRGAGRARAWRCEASVDAERVVGAAVQAPIAKARLHPGGLHLAAEFGRDRLRRFAQERRERAGAGEVRRHRVDVNVDHRRTGSRARKRPGYCRNFLATVRVERRLP